MKTLSTIAALALAGTLASCSVWTHLAHDDSPPPPAAYPGMPAALPPSHAGHMMVMPAIYNGDADRPGAPIFTNLGTHHHPITTRVPRTQEYFDQGVRLLFGFNHAEAIRSFREGARLDPKCAMCWWGVAFALGPNINLPMMPDAAEPAWQAVEKARALEDQAAPGERAPTSRPSPSAMPRTHPPTGIRWTRNSPRRCGR